MSRKKKILFIAVPLVITAIVLIFVFVNNKKQSTKSGEKVKDILEYEGYKTYFNYSSNYYDSDLKCHDYDHTEKVECERETDLWDFISIDMISDNSNIRFDAYYDINDSKITLYIIKELSDKSKFEYVISNNGEEDYYAYDDADGDICHIMYKTSELNEKNLTKCSKYDQEKIYKFRDEFNKKLKEMKLSKEDLIEYTKWYVDKTALPQYNKAKKELEKGITYDEKMELVKKSYFNIELSEDKTVVRIFYFLDEDYYQIFSFYVEDGKVNRLVYMASDYEQYILAYDKELKQFYGGDFGPGGNEKCLTRINIKDKYLNSFKTSEGYTCTKDDEDKIDKLKYSSFDISLMNLDLTIDELFELSEEYYNKNK